MEVQQYPQSCRFGPLGHEQCVVEVAVSTGRRVPDSQSYEVHAMVFEDTQGIARNTAFREQAPVILDLGESGDVNPRDELGPMLA
jgi:hypothetical protein